MKILKAPSSSLLLVFFCAITMSGCTTAAIYQPSSKKSDGLGYQDIQVNDSTYRIKFWGSEHNSEEGVNNAALYRVAEFTSQKGYDYFIILDDMKSFVKRGEVDSWYNPMTGQTAAIQPNPTPGGGFGKKLICR